MDGYKVAELRTQNHDSNLQENSRHEYCVNLGFGIDTHREVSILWFNLINKRDRQE